jgi:hypothetical protein
MLPAETRYLGKVLRDSRLVSLAGLIPQTRPFATPPDRPGDPVRYVQLSAPGDDGDELTDYDIIGSNRDGTGLFAFNRGPRIDLLAVPLPPDAVLGATALVAATRFCENARALLIWDPPGDWQSAESAMFASRRLEFNSGSVMTYFPRIRPRGSSARYTGGLPACGAIAGMLARRDRRGIFGRDEDADYTLRTALTPVLSLDMNEAQRLARCGINTFVHTSSGATRLVGRVTFGSGGNNRNSGSSLDRRRLRNFIMNSIEDAVAAAAADHDRDSAVQRVEMQLRRFFDELHAHGALPARTPEQAGFLRLIRSGPAAPRELHVRIAMAESAPFSEYLIAFEGPHAGRLRAVRPTHADQLFN